MIEDDRCKLPQLHALAADFHLIVHPADEEEGIIMQHHPQVAGPIDPAILGMVQNPCGCQFGLVEVAAKDLETAETHFAHCASWQDISALRIKYERRGVVEGTANVVDQICRRD